MSDIYLSQDSKMNIQGALFVDKLNLVKNKCAFPILFSNLEGMFTGNVLKQALNEILNLSTLEKIKYI